MKKSSKKDSKARLPPKRGQVKVKIFRWVAKKVTDIASMAGVGRKRSCVANSRSQRRPINVRFNSAIVLENLTRQTESE